MGKSPSKLITILPSFVAIDIVVVEMSFLYHVISQDHVTIYVGSHMVSRASTKIGDDRRRD